MHRVAPLFMSILAMGMSLDSVHAVEHPNIIYILVDNWGWGDISIQGSSVPTPRIDAFARQGIRFTNFNVQNQCTPTRSAIHTGRLPIRSGRILDAVRKAGIEKNTIVILTGDNAAGDDTDEGASNGPWRGGLSTAYEGGTRTVGMIRWPGKFAAGKVTDEIVSDLDWFSTITHLVCEEQRIPKDRPYDGVNQANFLLGQQEKSDREHILTYVGERLFAVKWRTLKVHFYTAESTFSPIVEHTFPQVYDINSLVTRSPNCGRLHRPLARRKSLSAQRCSDRCAEGPPQLLANAPQLFVGANVDPSVC